MSNEELNKDRLLQEDIKEKVNALLASIQEGDVHEVRNLIRILGQIKEDSLYQELGKLTRELHNTIKQIDSELTITEIPNAKIRLNRVISMTEEAANRTMDIIDATIPLANELAAEARELLVDWSKFKRREFGVEDFASLYQAMMMFLEKVDKTASEIHANLQNVLLAQDFQDLSGQAIKKVISVVGEVENKLFKLVKIAAEANSAINPESAHNQQLITEEIQKPNPEVNKEVTSQDEADDLVSSLGF